MSLTNLSRNWPRFTGVGVLFSCLLVLGWLGYSSPKTHLVDTTAHAQDCTPNAILVNPCRPWLGAAVHGNPGAAKDAISQFNYLEELIGHPLDTYRDYDHCASATHCLTGGLPLTPTERQLAEQGVYVDIDWLPVATNWQDADGGNATINAEIKQVADSIKSIAPHKIFLTIWHEPQNDVSAFDNSAEKSACTQPGSKFTGLIGKAGTPEQYIAMWRNVEEIFKQQDVTNVVWAMNYQGAPNWRCLVPALWPGNNLVDWVFYDTYDHDNKAGTTFDATAGAMYQQLQADSGKTYNAKGQIVKFDSKPWGLGEFGTCKNPSPQNSLQYYIDAKNGLLAKKYPRLKLYQVYADTGNNSGMGCLTNYDSSGQPDPAKQAAFNQLVDAIFNSSKRPSLSASITTPTPNSTVRGYAPVDVSASGPVHKVELLVDGKVVDTMMSAPYDYQWDTSQWPDGRQTLTAKALDSSGHSVTSTPVTVVTVNNKVPQVPSGLSSPSHTATSVSLRWSEPAGNSVPLKQFLIYRDGVVVAQVSAVADALYTPVAPAYTDTGLLPGTKYTYSVAAVSRSGNVSGLSSPLTVTTDKVTDHQSPTTPTGLQAKAATANQVNLNWRASTDNVAVAGYRIERDGTVIGTSATTSFGDATAQPNKTYHYRMAAYDASGNQSAYSAPVTVTTPVVHTPNPVHGVTTIYSPNGSFDGKVYLAISPQVAAGYGTSSPVPGKLPIHGYGIRWRGRVSIPSSGNWTFYTDATNGTVTLWVNNKAVIAETHAQSGEDSTTVTLAAGQYNLQAQYVNSSGPGSMALRWSGPGAAPQLVPTSALYPQRFGLRTRYYKNQNLAGNPSLYRQALTVDFDWGTGKPEPSIPADHWSAQWDGFVAIPRTGTYTFYTQTDDGARLQVNGRELVNDWRDHRLKQDSGSIYLKGPGVYPIDLQYYQDKGKSTARLLWSGPRIKQQVIPDVYLYENLPVKTKLITDGTQQ